MGLNDVTATVDKTPLCKIWNGRSQKKLFYVHPKMCYWILQNFQNILKFMNFTEFQTSRYWILNVCGGRRLLSTIAQTAPAETTANRNYRSFAQQQTSRTPLLLSIAGTDRQTDGQTDTRPLHRPCYAYYAASVNNTGLRPHNTRSAR